MSDDTDKPDIDADADAGQVLYLNFSGERPDRRADTADAKGTDDGWVGVDQYKAYDHDFSGELLGHRYKLEERIGVGHVSTLYRAKDRRLGITLAVKVLHPEHNQNADLMRRFTQEARLASQVRHPNLVPAVDFAGLGMRRFIVFELVKGRTVNDHMFEETFPWRRATEIICDLLAGLSAMHEAGVVHRDISPLNCLVDTANGGRGRLIDFGYVRLVDKRGGLDIAMPPQTKSMMIYGTEGYIEPERLHGGPADERSDIFSIGAVWYAMVLGRPPLDPSSLDVAFTPIVLPLPMPEPLVAVLRGALAPRAERHASAATMLDAIRHALAHVDGSAQQVRVGWRRRAGVLGAVLGGGVVAAALSLSLSSPDPRCPEQVAVQDVDRVAPPLTAPASSSRAGELPQAVPVPVTPPVPAKETVVAGWQQQGSSVLVSSSPPSPERSSTPHSKRAATSSSPLRRALAACKSVGGGRFDVTVAPGERATINEGPPRGELGRCIGDALVKHPPTRRETFKL